MRTHPPERPPNATPHQNHPQTNPNKPNTKPNKKQKPTFDFPPPCMQGGGNHVTRTHPPCNPPPNQAFTTHHTQPQPTTIKSKPIIYSLPFFSCMASCHALLHALLHAITRPACFIFCSFTVYHVCFVFILCITCLLLVFFHYLLQ